ncbi:conserved hypothetical protein [Pseudomonas sp. 8AS]|uniref:DUF2789 domain-containing protein n=1 Tax=Pseudomonas sp. 8AS TaxID=2653163 RepID=UPI0012F3721A|nr:DUF2789 domain-containing protein [Pseudomonas sp. 8AS]VXB36080.1 conserved hypothetical protein [Pseudomonas sp. 8AS]
MDTSNHSLSALFEQLGLPAGKADIEAFIRDHQLLEGQGLAQAPFWSESQAAFIGEALDDDSDWAERVDELALLLSK